MSDAYRRDSTTSRTSAWGSPISRLFSFIILPCDACLNQGFGSAFFFADPDPGKSFDADPDPDPGGIRGRGVGVKGTNDFFFSFFHVSDDS